MLLKEEIVNTVTTAIETVLVVFPLNLSSPRLLTVATAYIFAKRHGNTKENRKLCEKHPLTWLTKVYRLLKGVVWLAAVISAIVAQQKQRDHDREPSA